MALRPLHGQNIEKEPFLNVFGCCKHQARPDGATTSKPRKISLSRGFSHSRKAKSMNRQVRGPPKRSVSGLTTIPDKIGASRAHWVDAASINFAGASSSNTARMMKSGSAARSRSCARDFIAERLQRHDAAMRKARSCRENE
jgi:hypothetical protein